jgi:Secretion system C-terminal sorting domain
MLSIVVAKTSYIMKKNTLLFVTMLAMSGMAFGQKEPKVLWKKNNYLSLEFGYDNSCKLSSKGFMLVYNSVSASAYDPNGNLLWKATDFFNKPNAKFVTVADNPKYTVIRCDSGYAIKKYLYFDENYKFIKEFDLSKGGYFSKADDGVLFQDSEKNLIKYDVNGKEEWRYKSDTFIYIQNSSSPYVGSIVLPSNLALIAFNKNGKVMGITTDLNNSTRVVIATTKDEGFWVKADNDQKKYIKYDSTGRKTTSFHQDSLPSRDKTIAVKELISPDNSLVLVYFNTAQELCLTKINPDGKINTIIKNFSSNLLMRYYTDNYFKISKEGILMYDVLYNQLPYYDRYVSFIGAEKFEDKSFGWFKKKENNLSYDMRNTVGISDEGFIDAYITPLDRTSVQLTNYGIDGKVKWSSLFTSKQKYIDNNYSKLSRVKDVLFLEIIGIDTLRSGFLSLYQLDVKTGKILWKIENKPDDSNYFVSGNLGYTSNIFSIDNQGNTFKINTLSARRSFTYLRNITVIGKDGLLVYEYKSLKNYTLASSYGTYGFVKVAQDGSILCYVYPDDANYRTKFFFQKVSPCSYNTTTEPGTVVGTTEILSEGGKTEACPTEKIKLTATQYDGAVYEWQKDGKVVPALKEAVQNMTESGTYKLTIKDTVCQYSGVSNEVKINIRTLPTAEIKASQTNFCEGEKANLSTTTNGTFIQWQKDQKDLPNLTGLSLVASTSGDYRVGVRDEKCPQIGYSNVIPIKVKPFPEANISTDIKGVIYEPNSVKMNANAGTGLSYQWLKDDVVIPNETNAIYEAKKSGKYNVSVSKEGCAKISDALTISILIPLANQEEVGEEQVQVYPNPSDGKFRIILPKSLKSADIQLFDSYGSQHALIHTGEQAQTNGLIQGVYFLKVSKGDRSVTSKIVIE